MPSNIVECDGGRACCGGCSRDGCARSRCARRVALCCFDAWGAARGPAAAAGDVVSEVATVWRDPLGWARRPVRFYAAFAEAPRPGRRRPRRVQRECAAVFVGADARVASHFWRRSRAWRAAELAALVHRNRRGAATTLVQGVAWCTGAAEAPGAMRSFAFEISWSVGTWRLRGEGEPGGWGEARALPAVMMLGEFLQEVVAPPAKPVTAGGHEGADGDAQ